MIFFFAFLGVLVLKLFTLQVIQHDHYMQKALADHQGYTELDPRRGEIFIQDFHSGSEFRVATNTTLDTVFADPFLIDDPLFVADKLAPLLFDEEIALRGEELRLKEQRKLLAADLTEDEVKSILKPRGINELELEFRQELLDKISLKIRESILLYQDPEDSVREQMRRLNLSGIEITDRKIVAYPSKIHDRKEYAAKLTVLLDIPVERLESLFEGKNRYTILATKIEPSAGEAIKEIVNADNETFRGIGFEQRSYRFYPEKGLAAQVLGFVDSQGGRYGIEEAFNESLTGTQGLFKTQLDGLGHQITVGSDTVIDPAIDGSDIYLTIERSIQLEVERILKQHVVESQADSGQVMVMDPKTGRILSLAHYPTYDPNEFWRALDTEEIFLDEEERERIIEFDYASGIETYFVEDEETDTRIQLIPLQSEQTGEVYYDKFKNNVGAAVYRNRTVGDVYEPGSIFKPMTMSAAIDSDTVTPHTTVVDNGPIKVDEYWIDNALGKHYGTITMTEVLEVSNNIGIAWITQEIGRALFHSYIEKFGFGRRTDIDFAGEKTGKVKAFTSWADSELVTHGFGQGISVTQVQMITAFSAIANEGVLMEPKIVDHVVHSDGVVDEYEPTVVRRVVSKKTADTIVAMLNSVVEKGHGGAAQVTGDSVAGKTGTSQTYKNGVPLEGVGTTIASFAGFAPASDPQFVVLVKVDKPRTSQWGSDIAAPVFADVTEYLLKYMNVAPDKY